ncbi:MAG: BrnA antitoxin family protein [Proteobacteria bacterium]|jgi:uncharacterized protein (DUF4415 family)|nr:BrnA antitoxin family protein [Pseudomonadota bacterium]
MSKRRPLTNRSGEVRELARADFARFRPAPEVLPTAITVALKRGRPKLEAPRQMVSLRLEPDVVAALRATGRGWQTRVNALLRDAVLKKRA